MTCLYRCKKQDLDRLEQTWTEWLPPSMCVCRPWKLCEDWLLELYILSVLLIKTSSSISSKHHYICRSGKKTEASLKDLFIFKTEQRWEVTGSKQVTIKFAQLSTPSRQPRMSCRHQQDPCSEDNTHHSGGCLPKGAVEVALYMPAQSMAPWERREFSIFDVL